MSAAGKKVSSVKVEKAVDQHGKESRVQVVRVQAYPIDGALVKVEGQPAIPIQIVRLTEVGFLAKLFGYMKVGDTYNVSFKIPVLETRIAESVRVIKTYESLDGYSALPGAKKGITVEFHFKNVSDASRSGVKEFISKIGQKG